MKFKLSKGKIFLLLIIGLIAVHFVFFRAPSEAQMIAKFHAHKAEFEQIRLMMEEDNVREIGPNWVEMRYKKISAENGSFNLEELPLKASPARLALYRSRLKALGLDSARLDQFKNRIRLYQFGGGFTDTSWSIGYAWSKNAPKPLVKSAYNQMPGREGMNFSRIEGDWYLYHSR